MCKLALAALLLAFPAAAQPKSGKTTATWWGHAAWIVKSPGGATIAIDPWLKNPLALAARLLRVKTVIPMHFGTFPALTGTPDQLSAALKKSGATARVVVFKPGETKEL